MYQGLINHISEHYPEIEIIFDKDWRGSDKSHFIVDKKNPKIYISPNSFQINNDHQLVTYIIAHEFGHFQSLLNTSHYISAYSKYHYKQRMSILDKFIVLEEETKAWIIGIKTLSKLKYPMTIKLFSFAISSIFSHATYLL